MGAASSRELCLRLLDFRRLLVANSLAALLGSRALLSAAGWKPPPAHWPLWLPANSCPPAAWAPTRLSALSLHLRSILSSLRRS